MIYTDKPNGDAFAVDGALRVDIWQEDAWPDGVVWVYRVMREGEKVAFGATLSRVESEKKVEEALREGKGR